MNELISSGIELMLVGMGLVFLFLAMLIVVVNLMSTLIKRYIPERPIQTTPITVTNVHREIAAITAAVHQYKNRHKGSSQ
jgi:oxaloacetate decarboxylase (Na+ extruding) subunit gamma